MPAMPMPLLARAAMMPATAVPCTSDGVACVMSITPLTTDVPSARTRSGLRSSMPPSTTATVTGSPGKTGICGHASKARTSLVFHCWVASGSVGAQARVRVGERPMRTIFEADGL